MMKRSAVSQQDKKAMLLQNIMLLLLMACILSACIGIVYVKHATRQMFSELHQLQAQRDEMNLEWTQLLLEQSTLTSDGRVDTIARQSLDMHAPNTKEMAWVKR